MRQVGRPDRSPRTLVSDGGGSDVNWPKFGQASAAAKAVGIDFSIIDGVDYYAAEGVGD